MANELNEYEFEIPKYGWEGLTWIWMRRINWMNMDKNNELNEYGWEGWM